MSEFKAIAVCTAACTLAGLLASPLPAKAMGGGIGCTNLPEYYRALGTIENGEGSCDMTMDEAKRIIAREQARTAPTPAQPAAHHHHRHRVPTHHP